MRWTELTLIPTCPAIIAAVQWVASTGGSGSVSATTRSATSGSTAGMRDGRVLSRNRPSMPSSAKRSCHRQTPGLRLTRPPHDLDRADAGEAKQHDLGSPDMLLGGVA